MDRRNFLRNLIGGVAMAAAVPSWPFRVYSFPSEVAVPAFEIPAASQLLTIEMITKESLAMLERQLNFVELIN